MPVTVRGAAAADCDAIACIYNEGIADRIATFETELRSQTDIQGWLHAGHVVVVVELEGEVAAFASTSSYRPRACYEGVREFSVYVARKARGMGLGLLALDALSAAAADRGYWKLVSRVFAENQASRRLLAKAGFREVGIYLKHGKLDGEWRDCVIVEKLIGEAAA